LWQHFSKKVRLEVPAERHQLIGELVSIIRKWSSAIMVHENLKKLANLAKVPEALLGVEGGLYLQGAFQKKVERLGLPTVDPDRVVEADIIRWLILAMPSHPYVLALIRANITPEDFRVPIAQKLYRFLEQRVGKMLVVDFVELVQEIDDAELDTFLSEVLHKKVALDKIEELVGHTITRIKERNLWLKREQIKSKIHMEVSEEEAINIAKEFDLLKSQKVEVVYPQK
jgi:DNA primase